jgi:hypothetical protein
MPYKNIVFVKLEKRLLNDPRWWIMSEHAQLIYVKLILLAAETYNKLPLNDIVLKEALRSRLELNDFQICLKEIQKSFPKFKRNKYFRYFAEFDSKTNYIKDRGTLGKARGVPKEGIDKEKEIDKDKEEEKEKEASNFEKQIMEIKKMDDIKKVREEYFTDFLPITSTQKFIETWLKWCDFRRKCIKKKLTVESVKEQINFLLEQPDPIECINRSIRNGWQGLFPIKENSKGNNHHEGTFELKVMP